MMFVDCISFADEHQNEKVLFKSTTKDSTISAIWIGVDPNVDSGLTGMPLTFGVHKLVFEFSNDKKRIEFKPKGDLFFSDWSFEIFSPDYRYVVLLQDHFGPYHIIPIDGLRDYLEGENPQFEVADGQIPRGAAAIHGEITWHSDDEIEFSASCCGGGYMVTHRIGGKTKYGKWKAGEGHLK